MAGLTTDSGADDDLGAEYLASRTSALTEGPAARILRQGAARLPVSPATDAAGAALGNGTPTPAPAEPAGPDDVSAEGARGVAARKLAGAGRNVTPERREQFRRGFVDFLKAVPLDLAQGAMEAPGSIVRGVAEGADEMLKAGDAFATWFNDNVIDTRVPLPEGWPSWLGNPAPALEAAAKSVGEIVGPRSSVTGKGVEFVAQWLTGRGAAGNVAKAVGMDAARYTTLLKDMASGAIAFDPKDPTLAETIKNAAGSNPLTDWLASDKDENEALARLKNALEAGGLGAATDAVIKGFRALKAGAAEPRAPGGAPAAAEAPSRGSGERAASADAAPRDWLPVGDPVAPLVSAEGAAAKAKLFLTRFRKLDVTAPATLEDLEKVAAAEKGARASTPAMNDLIEMVRGNKAPPKEGPTLAEFLRRNGGVQDEGGELAAMGQRPRGKTSLVRADGQSLDDAALQAWEAGFFPGHAERPTINEFLDTLRQDLSGKPVRGLGLPADEALRGALKHLDEAVGRMGLNLDEMSNAEIEKALYGAAASETRGLDDLVKEDAAMRDRLDKAFESATKGMAPVQINLARIDSADKIDQAIGMVSRMLPPKTTLSLEETKAAARELGMTPEQLLAMEQGGAMDARQITAARVVMASAAQSLRDLARKASGIGASEADVAAFNRAFALTYGIVAKVKGSSTEIARALSAHRIVAESEPAAVKAVRALLERSGGVDAARDMAAKIALLDDPAQVATLVGEAAKGSTADKIAYVYMNMLVSNPPSHVANVAGNTAALAVGMWEKFLAGKISSALGTADGVAEGEALAGIYSLWGGARDGFRAAGKALTTGQQSFGVAKEMASPSALGATPLESAGPLAGVADYLKVLLPARWLGAEDEVFKWVNYRKELSELAFRQASQEGLTGAQMADRVAELTTYPTDALHELASAAARKATFNAPLGPALAPIAKAIQNWTFEIRPGVDFPVGKVLMPFITTPTNIFKWSFERAGPLAMISRGVRADLAAGGARRDLALARMSTGMIVGGLALDLALSGTITGGGPKDPNLRANLRDLTGWQPYSVKGPDGRWYSYGRLDTPGQLAGAVADAVDILAYAKDEDAGDVAAAIMLAASKAVTSKTYMGNFAKFLDAVSQPERYGEKFVQNLAGSAVPALAASLERVDDPTVRAVYDVIDAVKARTPGFSKDLPPRTDLFGNDIRVEGAYLPFVDPRYAQLVSPIAVSTPKASPIGAELVRLRLKLQPVGQHAEFDGVSVELEPKEVYRYAQLQGQDVKDPRSGLGLEATLDAMVAGEGRDGETYARLGDDGKAAMIRQKMQTFRAVARTKLMEEFPALAEAIAAGREAKADAIRPQDAGGLRIDVPVPMGGGAQKPGFE